MMLQQDKSFTFRLDENIFVLAEQEAKRQYMSTSAYMRKALDNQLILDTKGGAVNETNLFNE